MNAQYYIYKLERLKDYMGMVIDGYGSHIWLNIDAVHQITPEQFLRLYAETGMMFYNSNPPPEPVKKLSFEEWFEKVTTN
jgi:hypothetical protein